MATLIASANVVSPIIVNSFTYLGGKELINFLTIVLVGVLLCGSTRLQIFLKQVVYSEIFSSSSYSRASHFLCHTSTWALVLNLATNFSTKLCLWSVASSQCCILCQLSINHSLASSLRNPPITSRRSVSSHPLASASTTKFSRKNVGFSPTFPENGFDVVMGFPLLAWPFIIHSATNLSLFSFCSCKVLSWETGIFLRGLGCSGFLESGSSSLLLLSSPPPPLAGGIFLWLLWFSVSFPLPLSGLLDSPEKECPV